MVTLKKAEANDLVLISDMANKIWNLYYIDIISGSQIDYMLEKFYKADALKMSVLNGEIFYLICINDFPVGYISASCIDKNNWFINKFYLFTDMHRKGIGTIAFKEFEKIINPNEFTLQVNRKNIKSINFYIKNGFYIREWADFEIGNGYKMKDFVLIKKY
ncbi:MAG: GNAT family N-acetyltransferase [Bacteroidia bacterium]|nr:GNAT family N-acetyltransferase [Bacteroidia bacterium]